MTEQGSERKIFSFRTFLKWQKAGKRENIFIFYNTIRKNNFSKNKKSMKKYLTFATRCDII